jgi:hypothetical protein
MLCRDVRGDLPFANFCHATSLLNAHTCYPGPPYSLACSTSNALVPLKPAVALCAKKLPWPWSTFRGSQPSLALFSVGHRGAHSVGLESQSDVRWYWALVERQHNPSWRTTDKILTRPCPRPLDYRLVLPLAVPIRPLPWLHFHNNHRLLPRFLPAAAILVTRLPAHTAPLKSSTCRI